MTGERKRHLVDSFRLLYTDEQWFIRDLVAGVAAFAAWVAGTGAVATRVAAALGLSLGLAPEASPSVEAVAVLGVLWAVVPAFVVAARIRGRTRNVSGNVEKCYRVDHPAALLVPPALPVSVVVAAVVALGAVPWAVTLAMVPVGLYLLVRTLAFSHRVYAFSHPLVVQASIALSTAALLGSSFAATATAAGRGALVDRILRVVGVPAEFVGVLPVPGLAVTGPQLAAFLPVFLAGGYVLVQTVAALGVRVLTPTVDRTTMRTGQRYPSFLDPSTPSRATGRQASDGGSAAVTGPADETGSVTPVSTGADGDAGEGESGESEAVVPDDDYLDDVSNTRVFTPPADGDDGDDPWGDAEGRARVTGTTGDDSGAETDGSDDRCDACGTSFTVDASVRFCPNCGSSLGAE